MSAEFALRFPQPEPENWLSVLLALLVHAVLAALLFLGVHWQTHAPEAVEVQLYSAPPTQHRAQHEPAPEVKPAPKPLPKVEPPPKPMPKVLPPPIVKPEIARKEKPKPVEKPKAVEKPVDTPKPIDKPRPPAMRDWSQELKEDSKATEQKLSSLRAIKAAEKDLQDMKAAQAAAALARGKAAWGDRIRAAIKRHIVVPPGISGNPEALFDVSILPDGTVLSAKLSKSTGYPALDAAIERAIRKASPLPKPDDPGIFTRELKLNVRPLEDRGE